MGNLEANKVKKSNRKTQLFDALFVQKFHTMRFDKMKILKQGGGTNKKFLERKNHAK